MDQYIFYSFRNESEEELKSFVPINKNKIGIISSERVQVYTYQCRPSDSMVSLLLHMGRQMSAYQA